MSHNIGAPYAAHSRLGVFKGVILGASPKLDSWAGDILASHHLRSGFILEGGGHADRQVCQVVGMEVYCKREEIVSR